MVANQNWFPCLQSKSIFHTSENLIFTHMLQDSSVALKNQLHNLGAPCLHPQFHFVTSVFFLLLWIKDKGKVLLTARAGARTCRGSPGGGSRRRLGSTHSLAAVGGESCAKCASLVGTLSAELGGVRTPVMRTLLFSPTCGLPARADARPAPGSRCPSAPR